LAGEPLSAASLEYARAFFGHFVEDVLGINLSVESANTGPQADAFIELLIDIRNQLRQAKQWALADSIRERLLALGIELRDGPDKTTWKRVS